MKHTTLLLLLNEDKILLAMKKRGFGEGRWNGVGGKIEDGETIEQAAIRECQEEIGVTPKNLTKVGHMTFNLPSLQKNFNGKMITHTFVTKDWEGEPIESEEMAPRWFSLEEIPYHKMWEDDEHWLPHVLSDKKVVCEFDFDENDSMIGKNVLLVDDDHNLLNYEL